MMNLLAVDRAGVDYLQQWIASSWPTTAAQSYENYLKAGRGLLLCDLAGAGSAPDFPLALRARCEYIPLPLLEQNAAGVLCHADDLPVLLAQVRAYDPEVQVFYCFTRKKGGPVFWLAGTELMGAREAYEQRPARPPQIPELRGRVVARG